MIDSKIVQIRKKGGLDKIEVGRNGSKLQPKLYHAANKKDDGVLEGDYKGKSILDTKHFISPMWSDLKKQWSWGGTNEDLVRLVDKMKLKYPKNHRMGGQLIVPKPENESQRLVDIQDEVFTHSDLYGKYFLESGRIGLDTKDPKQEFLLFCYKGDLAVEDNSRDEILSPYLQAGTKYEIVSPKREVQKQKSVLDKETDAIILLKGMENNEDKMRAIATIMSLPGYNPKTTSSDGLYILLSDTAAKNTKFSAKYNKTFQDRFIELAKLSDEDLNINYKIITAKQANILRPRTGHYLFNGEPLQHIDNDLQLINFFRDPRNQDKFIELISLLEEKSKQFNK